MEQGSEECKRVFEEEGSEKERTSRRLAPYQKLKFHLADGKALSRGEIQQFSNQMLPEKKKRSKNRQGKVVANLERKSFNRKKLTFPPSPQGR